MEVDQQAFRKALDRWEIEAPVDLLLSVEGYKKHFLEEYGIVIRPFEHGSYRIVDKQKYTMFLLRWS